MQAGFFSFFSVETDAENVLMIGFYFRIRYLLFNEFIILRVHVHQHSFLDLFPLDSI